VVLVSSDGEVLEGAEAVFRSLAEAPGHRWPLAAYRRVPGFAAAAEAAYRFIARHRTAGLRVTNALWGKTVEPPTYRITNSLFVRAVGICFFAAFVSLWVQVDGLVGSRGILPVGNLLEAARSQLSTGERWTLLPTLCWWNGSDAFLHFLCGAGALASLAVILGLVPAPALLLCWASYLSLCVAGQDFLEFQWDLLLLETGLLAVFLAPVKSWRMGPALEPDRIARVLLLWLLFRLVFSSGFVKLASGDAAWRNLTALAYHYWTQPLPPWTAWYASLHPLWFLKLSCVLLFAIELGAPFFILAPRRLRLLAAGAMAVLQAMIAATGNYAFFNFLTIALCLLLIDDAAFPVRLREKAAADPRAGSGRWPRLVLLPVAGFLLLTSLIAFSATLRLRVPWPGVAISIARAAVPFRSVNTYGLFAVMTTSRPEIVMEGSSDGVTWKAYEFRWKPGDLQRSPRFVAPHQPRLDWQMWFAALGSPAEHAWFFSFCARLFEGNTEVTGLLGKNPFRDAPPRYLRAVLYEYRFATAAERRATGAWWAREEKGLYAPVLSREMLRR
jgi:hypothetical protein